MSIQPSGGIGVAPMTATDNPLPPGITPDLLLVYCQSRLDGLASQMNDYFSQQQKANAASSSINDALRAFNDHGGGTATYQDNAALSGALNATIEKVGFNTPEGQKLYAILCHVRGDAGLLSNDESQNGGTSKPLTAAQVTGYIEDIKGVQTDLNSGTELDMMKLQSLMSQRQTAIQMTTNLVQALGEQSKMIAANIGK